MLVSAREETVNLTQSLVSLVSAFAPSAVAFLKDKVGNVPIVWRGSLRPSAAVDLGPGILLHPLHGGMLARLIVPIAVVDEGVLRWEGHGGDVFEFDLRSLSSAVGMMVKTLRRGTI